MIKAKAPDGPAYRVWDRVRVSKEFFDLLITHPVFRREPKAINTAQYWLNAIDAAMERNDDNPVTWDWKDIQDRFRPYNQSHKDFRDALRDLGLLTYTPYRPPANDAAQGECRNFTITPLGRSLLSGGNYQWLCNLLKDPQTRRRNQVAVSKRKKTRTVYTEPMMQIIDAFRYALKFDEDGYLKQLEQDKEACLGRFGAALHGLLAFERKRFGELELKEGRVCHEFVVLPRAYRPFAVFKGKPYVATVDIRACWPTFLGRFLWEYYQGFMVGHHGTTTNALEREPEIVAWLTNEVSLAALEGECIRWTVLFTNHPDPRDVIMHDIGVAIDRRDMKKCVNCWLNGARKYIRVTNGRYDKKTADALEAWFQSRFPNMAKVWKTCDRSLTGGFIADEYERKIMLDPALYGLGDELGLTLSYEYDGVGVFAERGDPKLPAKLDKVAAFIQRQSAKKFQVPVVVKAELLPL